MVRRRGQPAAQLAANSRSRDPSAQTSKRLGSHSGRSPSRLATRPQTCHRAIRHRCANKTPSRPPPWPEMIESARMPFALKTSDESPTPPNREHKYARRAPHARGYVVAKRPGVRSVQEHARGATLRKHRDSRRNTYAAEPGSPLGVCHERRASGTSARSFCTRAAETAARSTREVRKGPRKKDRCRSSSIVAVETPRLGGSPSSTPRSDRVARVDFEQHPDRAIEPSARDER